MLFKNIKRNESKMGVFTNLLRQVNAKCGLDLYRMRLPQKVKNANTMFVGVDVVNMGRQCIVGMAASYNQHQMQYYSDVAIQELYRDMIGKGFTKRDQEEKVCQERKDKIVEFMSKAFKNYVKNNQGKRPEQIIVYRDGVGGPSYQEFVLKLEGPGGAMQEAIRKFDQNYNPKMLYVLVNKKHLTRLFEKVNGETCNPGPGTVVDVAIVESNGQNLFDFFMIANDNPRTATAQPVHYSVVANTTGMTKTEVEEVTYQ